MRRSEKHELTEECHRLAKTIAQMEVSLDDIKPANSFDENTIQVTYPLKRCLQGLKEKYNVVNKLHRERYEQVKSTSLPSSAIC
jgi:Ase1/PRC1/MAP65 family protein